jgi:hypothetical protein
MNENQRLRLYLALTFLPFLLLAILSPPAWLGSIYDRLFTSKFTSAEGGFSIDVPRRRIVGETSASRKMFEYRVAGYRRFGGDEFLDAWHRNADRSYSRRISHYALVNVRKTALPPGPAPSVEETAESLFSKTLGRWTNVRFEIREMKAYRWGKTTLTSGNEALVYWYVVDDRRNLYVAAFCTDRFSAYHSVFEKMMESFSFRH